MGSIIKRSSSPVPLSTFNTLTHSITTFNQFMMGGLDGIASSLLSMQNHELSIYYAIFFFIPHILSNICCIVFIIRSKYYAKPKPLNVDWITQNDKFVNIKRMEFIIANIRISKINFQRMKRPLF